MLRFERNAYRTAVFLCYFALYGLLAGAGASYAQKPDKTAQAAADATAAKSFQNPVLWEDLADIDILRVENTYYYSASTMHYSPGAPILRSYDLVHWDYVGHSVPVLDFGPAYDMQGSNAYVRGIWASFLGYRKSNKTFYWGGCIDFAKTYIYTATAVEGPWQRKTVIDKCYYDAGLLVDDDDTMYVAYGNTKLNVAQLSADGTKQVKTELVFTTPADVGMLEGSRFYKINGNYYIFATRPPNGEYVLKSTTGPFGPYTMQKLALNVVSPVAGGGAPHQGGIVQTQKGDWYYMGFTDAFPGGRVPVLAPVKWGADGWPVLQLTGNTWDVSYPTPQVPVPPHAMKPPTGTDAFKGSKLSAEWEWNHNPDNAKWSLGGGLNLQAATVTNDLYSARNTLTHRILGPTSTATIMLDYSRMKDGDRAGLALLRDRSAWAGIKREAGAFAVVMENNLTMDKHWKTVTTGTEVASAPVTGGKIWLRASADIRPGAKRTGSFAYSTDGVTFQNIGEPFVLNNEWMFFMGYRYGIFNYATQSLGGAVKVSSFTMATP
ncbi:MAG: glycoside hydrolase 43 family protein [Acidobacteriaceae bacterium]|nr:glycoside hydrolase 43 family protein [Acidobacteriaceae bacterium]